MVHLTVPVVSRLKGTGTAQLLIVFLPGFYIASIKRKLTTEFTLSKQRVVKGHVGSFLVNRVFDKSVPVTVGGKSLFINTTL